MLQLEQTILGPDQTEEARQIYNVLADSWRLRGLTISHVYRQLFPIIPSQADYAIGPNGDIDIPWPERLDRVSVVVSGSTPNPEYKLWPLTVDDWQHWVVKTETANWPNGYFYERKYPIGILHLLYVPTDGNQLALYLETSLPQIDATGDELIDFPPGYQQAIQSNMAVLLAARYPTKAKLSPITSALARSSLMAIEQANNRPLSRTTLLSESRYGGRSNVLLGNRYGQS